MVSGHSFIWTCDINWQSERQIQFKLIVSARIKTMIVNLTALSNYNRVPILKEYSLCLVYNISLTKNLPVRHTDRAVLTFTNTSIQVNNSRICVCINNCDWLTVAHLVRPKSATLTMFGFLTRQLRAARSLWIVCLLSRYAIPLTTYIESTNHWTTYIESTNHWTTLRPQKTCYLWSVADDRNGISLLKV